MADKIVFDAFRPNEACNEKFPTDPQVTDECKVEVEIHEKNKSESTERILFYRDKTTYLFDPQEATKVIRLRELGFDDQNASVRDTISMAVELKYSAKAHLLDPNPKLQTEIAPFVDPLIDFIAGGELTAPDELQRKRLSSLIAKLGQSSEDVRGALFKFIEFIRDGKWLPDANRPRVEWLVQLLTFSKEISKSTAALKEEDDLKKALDSLPFEIMDYLSTDRVKLKTLKETLDRLQIQLDSREDKPEAMKDLFAFFTGKLEPFRQSSWLQKNLDARKRLNGLLGHLREAVEQKRADLIPRQPNDAFQRALSRSLLSDARTGHLANRVKEEMDDANLDPAWLKGHAKEIIGAILPHLKLVQQPERAPRIVVDVAKMEESIRAMIGEHGIQEREYNIGALAVLRTLFGKDLEGNTLEGWARNEITDIELSFSEGEQGRLQKLGTELRGDISSSLAQTDIILPIIEGTVLAGSLGIGIYGLLGNYEVIEKKDYSYPLSMAGVIGTGLGTGALLCHFLFESRNPYISDTICGVVGGVVAGSAFGLATGFLDRDGTGEDTGPAPSDGRNPIKGYGP